MQATEATQVRELSAAELEQVNGGWIFLAFVAGKAIGAAGAALAYGIAKAID